ncbi:MAG: hypothetical protein J6S40_05265 [Thermoguttaceae bacterium]|nr:hypothetical protein [Thermoguttaceae bacterium]
MRSGRMVMVVVAGTLFRHLYKRTVLRWRAPKTGAGKTKNHSIGPSEAYRGVVGGIGKAPPRRECGGGSLNEYQALA